MQILQIFLLTFGLLNLAFAGSLYFHSAKTLPIIFYALISVFASLWSLSTLLMGAEGVPFSVFVVGANGHYIFGYLAYLSFFWFSFFYPSKLGKGMYMFALLITAGSAFILLLIPFTDFLFLGLREAPSLAERIVFNIPGYLTFILALSSVFVAGLFILIYRALQGRPELRSGYTKNQLYFTILSNFTAGTLGIVFNLLYPLKGDFSLFFVNPIFVAIALTGIGFYNLLRYKLFNIRTVLAEFFMAGIWIVFLARLLFFRSTPQDLLLNEIYLGSVTIFGIFLIRSVLQEIRQAERIEAQEHELEEANRRQENLIHFISHEVKGYLAKSEAGFAAILEGDYGPVNDDMKGMVSVALRDTRAGVDTVMDILQAGDFKKGTVSLARMPFDVSGEVAKAVEDLRPAAAAKGLALSFSYDRSGNYMVVGDAPQFHKHVVQNLIDNAIKYTPSGEVRVSLSRDRGKILLKIEDSGVGITPEDMARLFTEGGRGKDSIKVNAHSTGYGLFIAKSIVDAHRGRIWAQSKGAGQGSVFFVELPAKDALPMPTAARSTPAQAGR